MKYLVSFGLARTPARASAILNVDDASSIEDAIQKAFEKSLIVKTSENYWVEVTPETGETTKTTFTW